MQVAVARMSSNAFEQYVTIYLGKNTLIYEKCEKSLKKWNRCLVERMRRGPQRDLKLAIKIWSGPHW